jgi:hypothetical protein
MQRCPVISAPAAVVTDISGGLNCAAPVTDYIMGKEEWLSREFPRISSLVTVHFPAKSSSSVNNNTLRDAHKTQKQRFGAAILRFSVTFASLHSQKTRRVYHLWTVTFFVHLLR